MLSLIFVVLRNLRFFVHHGVPDFVEFFGYGPIAFVLSLPITFIISILIVSLFGRAIKNEKLMFILAVLLVAIPVITNFGYNEIRDFAYNPYCNYIYGPMSRIFPPIEPSTKGNTVYVIFTFDIEEDLIPGDRYLDSYKYIDSGILEYIAKNLHKHNISATFYVTPNVARDRPEALRMLERYGHEVGLHMHVHTMKNISYPYILRKNGSFIRYDDMIKFYNYSQQLKFLKDGKRKVETVLGHEIYFYRSGYYSCSLNTEKAAKAAGFKAIANHRGVFYIEPIGIWNLGRVDIQLYTGNLTHLIYQFEEKRKSQRIINIFAHPMYYYNHTTNTVELNKLKIFSEFLDYLEKADNVKVVNSSELLNQINRDRDW